MTDTENTDVTLTITGQTNDSDFSNSVWAQKFELPSFKSNLLHWNKEWEKILTMLSFSKDVFPVMGSLYAMAWWDATDLHERFDGFKEQVTGLQDLTVKMWDDIEKNRHFSMVWLLLSEDEHKWHLTAGLEQVCQHVSIKQDSHVLCPEITVSSMLKQKGCPFNDFVGAYVNRKKAESEGTPYLLQNEWWDKGAENLPKSLLDKLTEFTLDFLAFHRNEFICKFVKHQAYVDMLDT